MMSDNGAPAPAPVKTGKKYQIVFISAEVAPWSQTGGLGAVCDGLPIALAKAGHRVMSIAPRYDQYEDAWDTSYHVNCKYGIEDTEVGFFHTYKSKVDRVWVDHPCFLEKVWGLTKEKLYGPKWGVDYTDNQKRFSLFAQACVQAIKGLPLEGETYGDDVIILCNDWHSSLVPLYIDIEKKTLGLWKNAKVMFVTHNMVFQGRFPLEADHAKILNLPQSYIEAMSCFMPLRVGRRHPRVSCLNWMLGAFKYSDKILTVSPNYATEITKGPIKGVELNDIALEKGGVYGVLNGLKDSVYPNNKALVASGAMITNFNIDSLDKKALCKAALQEHFELPVNPDIPVICFLGRYDVQKGTDVMFAAMEKEILPKMDVQVIIMGSGNEELVTQAKKLVKAFPEKFKAVLTFKGAEKFGVYAGADFALMPSRYEPCGLVQMEGMRFGTIPLVTPTGGLADTVFDMLSGIVAPQELDPEDEVINPEDVKTISDLVARACKLFQDKTTLRKMQVAGMTEAKAFTWSNAARQYEKVFEAEGVKCVQHLVFKPDVDGDMTEKVI